MKIVLLSLVTHSDHTRPVAVGQEGDGGFFALGPVVVVLDNHEEIAADEHLFALKHHAADAPIEDVGALVAAGDDDGFVGSHLVVAAVETVDQLVARDKSHVGESR